MPITTVDELIARAAALVEPEPANGRHIAAFDADGTLWRGDIGDEAFARADGAGLVTAETWDGPVRAFIERYGLPIPRPQREGMRALVQAIVSGELAAAARRRGFTDDVWREDLYAMQAYVYAGHGRAAIAALADTLLAEGFLAGVFDDMRRLLDGLRGGGLRLVVVSASHGALVEAGVRALGIDEVFGMEPDVDDAGRTLPSIASSTYGEGKVRALGRRRTMFAFGDSVLGTDRALLAHAQVPVAVNAQGAHRDAALAADLMILDPR